MNALQIRLTLLFILAIFASNSKGQSDGGWKASPQVIEKISKERPGINFYEEKVPAYTLPDLFTTSDGKKITTSRQWEKVRRPEILEQFRENVYGRVPETAYQQSYKIVNLDKNALGGAATLKQVDITLTADGKSLVIHLILFTPNHTEKPVPAFLLINNRGLAIMDPTRKQKSDFWPVEQAIARGYGMAVFNNEDVDPDNFDEFKNGIHGLLDRKPRTGDSWGTIAAWAWGASRCMDYLITDKDVAGNKVAVVGHSRGGKTALWASAEDTRFAMTISSCSGNVGSSILRRQYGQVVSDINRSFPHWFCLNFRKFNDNEKALPVDMHSVLALTVPRAIYISNADEDLWADPLGSYTALYNAVPVYRLFGKNADIPKQMPALNKQIINANVAFHIRNGDHNMLLEDWNRYMDFADLVYSRKAGF